jgi:hypothetical protein
MSERPPKEGPPVIDPAALQSAATRWATREPWDGPSVLSDEVDLDGPVRVLSWVIVADDNAPTDDDGQPLDLHMLFDVDAHTSIVLGFNTALEHMRLTVGTVVAARGDINGATRIDASYGPNENGVLTLVVPFGAPDHPAR